MLLHKEEQEVIFTAIFFVINRTTLQRHGMGGFKKANVVLRETVSCSSKASGMNYSPQLCLLFGPEYNLSLAPCLSFSASSTPSAFPKTQSYLGCPYLHPPLFSHCTGEQSRLNSHKRTTEGKVQGRASDHPPSIVPHVTTTLSRLGAPTTVSPQLPTRAASCSST